MSLKVATTALTVLVLGLPAAASAAPASYRMSVLARGLDNPRGLAWGRGGLYVAEAGHGGRSCGGAGPEGPTCFGATARIERFRAGRRIGVAQGLASVAGPDGSFAVGADDVAVDGFGRVSTIITSINPPVPSAVPRSVRPQLGRIIHIRSGGALAYGAHVAGYEYAHDPDHQGKDSDPYGLAVSWFGARVYAADAAGNDLLRVRGSRVSLVSVFPNIGRAQAVPTTVRFGPHDNALYVGELAGEGAPAGAARVWRIVPGRSRRVFARGLSSITGMGIGPDGSVYVSEFQIHPTSQTDPRGDVVRIFPDGRQQHIGVGQLFLPGGVAVGRDGTIYVSNWSGLPARAASRGPFAGKTGEIVRLRPQR